MAFDQEFLELMSETFVHLPRTSIDRFGKGAFAVTGTAYVCHTEEHAALMRGADGSVATVTLKAYVGPKVGGELGDLLLTARLGDRAQFADATLEILDVHVLHDEDGAHHTVLQLGSADNA